MLEQIQQRPRIGALARLIGPPVGSFLILSTGFARSRLAAHDTNFSAHRKAAPAVVGARLSRAWVRF